MNAAELFAAQLAGRRDRPALIDARGETWSFGVLDDTAARLARYFLERGLGVGDSVLVMVPMSPALYATVLATLRLGITATFVSPSVGRARVKEFCTATGPRAVIGTPGAYVWMLATPELRAIPNRLSTDRGLPGVTPWRRIAARAPLLESVVVPDDTPALATPTSGTTGVPKLCVRTHGLLAAQHSALQSSLGVGPGMTDLCTLPLFVLMNLASGAATLLPDAGRGGTASPRRMLAQIERHRPTRLTAPPGVLEPIVDYCAAHGKRLKVGEIVTGGAPIFPSFLERVRAVAPAARVVAIYGATEAEPIATMEAACVDEEDRHAMGDGAGLLVGAPVAAVRLRIMRDQWGRRVGPLTATGFDELSVTRGEPGEIVVTGPHVMRSCGRPEDDALTKVRVEDEVWHRTGDAGYLDARDRLWLLGRCAPSRRDAPYPLPIEACAMADPTVRRAAVLQAKEARVLVVERDHEDRNGVSLEERLAWAQVDRIAVVRHIPLDRRHMGKIDYARLESRVQG